MYATRAVLVLLFAVVACAVAIPAALPQPESAVATGPIVGIQERSALEKRQIGAIEAGPEQAQDLKGSSSYGYGYYGGYGGYGYPYRPYGGYGWGYPYYGYGYPFYRPFYGYPYYPYYF